MAEGIDIDPPADANYENDMEKRKEDGFNRNVFFVTNDLCEKWVELPDVKPKQIILSRKIKYMFTGELNRKIHSNPDFNGEERHLLRCMLGRIYHGAKLVPSINHYTIEDQESPFNKFFKKFIVYFTRRNCFFLWKNIRNKKRLLYCRRS